MSGKLPGGRLLAYYGDDFTGSTDAMEVLAFNGLPTVLFLSPPDAARLAQFSGYRSIGIAGVSRSRTRAWMETHLPPIFQALHELGAPITQYKVCSTLDSAPDIGSIGKAIDLAQAVFHSRWVPLVIAAPRLRRYQAFGNLFASVDGITYRLDRHPTMARHPVTPMTEADVRLHVGAQTNRTFGLVSVLDLRNGIAGDVLNARIKAAAEIISLDVLDEEDLAEVGRLVWEYKGPSCFSASSSGLQYALIAYWRRAGLLDDAPPAAKVVAIDQIIAVSGSCSPTTGEQIMHALSHGFQDIRTDPRRLCDPATAEREGDRVVQAALTAARAGFSPLIYTASGSADPMIEKFRRFVGQSGMGRDAGNERLGRSLGSLLKRLLDATDIRRLLVAGGDTSGYCSQELGMYALTALAPVAPGAPLCRAYSQERALDGLQIALKGGQIGNNDYFSLVRSGGG